MCSSYPKVISIALLTAGTGLFSYLLFKYYSVYSKCKNTIERISYRSPQYGSRRSLITLDNADWENVGKVKRLWIYPVKSCKGLCFEDVTADKAGPKYLSCRDRSLVIIDENGDMMTGRKVSSTVLITPEYNFKENVLTLQYPHLQPMKIYLSIVEIEGVVLKGKVWDDVIKGLDCGDEVADWLTLALGRPCRLLYHGDIPSSRSTAQLISKYPLMNEDDSSLYGDLSGYMLMSEASLQDLRSRAKCEMYAENFRPNILIEGSEAYDEDLWTYVKVGEAIFRNIKPCDRCIFTTINYSNGKRNSRCEPLKTLKSYRCPDGKQNPCFGINLGVDRSALIKVGDDVSVLRS